MGGRNVQTMSFASEKNTVNIRGPWTTGPELLYRDKDL